MGSDLCVYPRRLIPLRKELINYDLRAPNGTTIPTFGWLPLRLNLGLGRDFTWRFMGRRHTFPRRHLIPLSFRPPGGLQTPPST
jgi:hypothetical protein